MNPYYFYGELPIYVATHKSPPIPSIYTVTEDYDPWII